MLCSCKITNISKILPRKDEQKTNISIISLARSVDTNVNASFHFSICVHHIFVLKWEWMQFFSTLLLFAKNFCGSKDFFVFTRFTVAVVVVIVWLIHLTQIRFSESEVSCQNIYIPFSQLSSWYWYIGIFAQCRYILFSWLAQALYKLKLNKLSSIEKDTLWQFDWLWIWIEC